MVVKEDNEINDDYYYNNSMNRWRRLQLPLSTPPSSSSYYSHPPLPLPSLLLQLMVAFNIVFMSCFKLVIASSSLSSFEYARRSVSREDGLAADLLLVILWEKWRGEEDEDRNSQSYTSYSACHYQAMVKCDSCLAVIIDEFMLTLLLKPLPTYCFIIITIIIINITIRA
jgi:hypothetical protein